MNGNRQHGLPTLIVMIVLIGAIIGFSACEAPPRRDFAGDNHCTKGLWQISFVCRDLGPCPTASTYPSRSPLLWSPY
jgi:hypothetical protein